MPIYFDITDVIDFAKRSTRLTGIQRVQLNIINLLARRHPAGMIRCVFFDRGRAAFFEFDPATRPHDVEFSGEQLLMDLGLLQPSGRFPSKVQIKGYLGRGQSGKLMRIVKKMDVYLSAILLPRRLRDLGFVMHGDRQRSITSVVLQRTAALPAQACLVNMGASWFFPETWAFARQHRERGGEVLQFIHDVIPVTHQQFMPPREPARFQQWLAAMRGYATHVTSNSHFTASEYIRNAAAEGHHATSAVTPLAHEFIGYARNADVSLPEELRQLQGQRFVITVGNIEVRKNGMSLVAAWKRLIGVLGDATPRLLFAGRYGRIGGGEIRAAISADPQLARFVSVIESPSDQALAWLYRNCLFSAYPSFVEGWGLPVGESAWFGRVCIASSTSSVPEVCGELMVYVDPSDQNEIFRKIHELVVSPHEIQLREAAIRNASLRTWADVADDLYALIESMPSPAQTKAAS